jgi:para-nitrobenzyl esterase
MPAAKGLFHRAVAQSGSSLRSGSADNAAKLAAAVLDELGISKSELAKLQTVPTRTLCTVQAAAQRRLRGGAPAVRGPGGMGGWSPIMDGRVIPAHPFDPVASPLSANVPMLIGTCLNEMVNGTDNPDRDTLTDADLVKRVAGRYKDRAADIIAAYRKVYPKESPFGIWAAISAAGSRQNAITQAERKAALGAAPAYMYIYAWRTPALGGKIGTFHASDLTFVFDNASICTNYSGGGPAALALSFKVGEAWASMARNGKPGHTGLPEWPAYNQKTRTTMVFDTPCTVWNDPETEGLRLIGQSA